MLVVDFINSDIIVRTEYVEMSLVSFYMNEFLAWCQKHSCYLNISINP